MSKLDQQLREDRALRDAAKAVLMADIEHARASFSAKGVADRVGTRIGDGAKDAFEVAKVNADDNRGIIAILIGAVLLWLSREPILEILGLKEAEPDLESDISETISAEDDTVPQAPPAPQPPVGEDDEH